MRRNKLTIAAMTCACLLFTGLQSPASAQDVNDFTALQSAIQNAASGSPLDITLINNISSIAEIYTKTGTNVTISGANQYSVTSDNADHRGFNVVKDSTLEINDATINNFLINQSSPDDRNRGGAISASGNLNINTSIFTNNKVGNADEPNGKVVMGGAVYANAGKINVYSTEFTENEARRGGALASEDNSSAIIVVEEGTFLNNKAGFAGGAVSNGGIMNIINSDFKGNTAEYSSDTFDNGGGAISNTGILYLQDRNSFDQNISYRNGGAILNRSNVGSHIVITDLVFFTNNHSYVDAGLDITLNGGGAIFNNNEMTLGDTDFQSRMYFENNTTTATGGAIYNAKNMDINGSAIFVKNDAGFSGGAVANTGKLTLNGGTSLSKFIENNSGGNGGALANIGSMTVIGTTEYTNNTADMNGGAIFNNAKIIMDGTATFTGNESGQSGGAIYNAGDLTISGTATFTNNTANTRVEKTGGGAIDNSGTLTILGNRNGDIATTDASILFKNNKVVGGDVQSTGGAIHVGADLYLSGADFIGNSATRAGAIRGEGGGAGDSLYIDNAKFLDNTAERYGGAISSFGSSNIYLSNSYFNGNKVTDANKGGMGGAVTNGGSLTILNSTFLNNSATNRGGAVSFNGNQLTILADGGDTIFRGNTTTNSNTQDGLFIYTDGSPVVNFNAGNGNNIIFDDKVLYLKNNNSGSTQIQDINLNQQNIYYNHFEEIMQGIKAATPAPTNGNIIFNNNVRNVNLILHNGTLKIGENSSILNTSDNYFTNSSITLEGGTLDFSNDNIESGDKLKLNSLVVNGNANLEFDVDLSNNLVDYINTTIAGNGSLTIDKIKFSGTLAKNLGESQDFIFTAGNEVDNTELLESLKTVITSDAGYGLDLTSTNKGKDTLAIKKIVNAGGLPIAVSIGEYFDKSTYVYSATSDEIIDTWAKVYSVIDKDNQLHDNVTASNVLKGTELVINGNGKNIITTASDLEGISLVNGQTLTINNVVGWTGFNSAIINNGGNVNINNSIFKDNKSTSNGGAVRNLADGVLTINNSNFTDNSAAGNGGAIYNEGLVKIFANNAAKVDFSGNSTDIHNENGTLELSADKTSSITFNGKITGNNGIINIVDTNYGNVVFNNTVADSIVSLNNGTLQIGKDTSILQADDEYFDNTALNLNGGILDLQNGQLDTINVTDLVINNTPQINLDINLSGNNQSDNIVAGRVDSSNGTIYIGPINIIGHMADGTTSVVADFINQSVTSAIENVNKSITIDGVIYSVDVANNRLTIVKQGESGGLAYEVINDEHVERTYVVGSENENVTHWINGNNVLAGERLQILGGSSGKSIIGSNLDGIIVSTGQELDISNVTSYEGFKSAVINNGGTIKIEGTKFSNNSGAENGGVIYNNGGTVSVDGGTSFLNSTAKSNGGAIYNTGILNLNTFETIGTFVGDIIFENNNAGEGSDIYQTATGVTNITGNNGGILTFNGSIAGSGEINKNGNGTLVLNGDNSLYIGSYTQDGAYDDGVVTIGGKTVVSAGAKFFNGESLIKNSTLEWLTANDLDYSQTQKPKLTIESGNLIVGNDGVLTIDNGGSVADAVSIQLSGSLITNENMSVNGNLVGDGTLTANNVTFDIEGDNTKFNGKFVQNSGETNVNDSAVIFNNIEINSGKLNFLSGSSADSSILFKSTDSFVTITSNKNADTIISAINKGTNSNLDITLDNSDTAENLNVDGTNISNLTFLNNVTFSGDVTGAGTITNKGDLIVKGDASKFSGDFTQTAGMTTVNADGKVFGGDKNIQAGTLKIISSEAIDYTNVHLSSNAVLNHTATSNISNVINSTVFDFVGGASNAKAEFTASRSGITGNYNLAENIGNGNSNTISFENSKVALGANDYTGNTIYELNNSTLDLTTNSSLENYKFTNLVTNGTNKLDFNVSFNASSPDNIVLDTDTLTTGNSAVFNVGKIILEDIQNENGLQKYETSTDVLSGDASFDTASGSKVVSNGATTIYEYVVKITDNNKSIELEATDFANEYSLNKANIMSGNRFFHFSKAGTKEYHIGASLDPTESGDFYVTGMSDNPSDSTLSGILHDSITDKGSFFNIASDKTTNLHIEDLTIQDAAKTGNGSVVENNSETSVITIHNSVIKNNSATADGGAIYNANGTVTISDSSFENNAASGNGGAIYNGGTLNLSNVILAEATQTAQNDIYSTGTINTFNKNDIYSNISGSGEISNNGALNLYGDNSAYTGKFTQIAGTTTIIGKFFGGNNIIDNGILNWYTTNDLTQGASLVVNDGLLNIGNDSINALLTLDSNSSVADKAIINLHKNANLNISGADVTLNSNDYWGGKINLNSGKLNLNNLNGNGILDAENGTLNLNSGNLIIGSGSKIDNAVQTAIADKTTLGITGSGNVELNDNDSWVGNVIMNGGKLSVDNITSNGKLQASNGTVELVNGELTIADGSVITGAVETLINNNSDLKITDGGIVQIDNNDLWSGKISLQGGTLNYNTTQSGTLAANTGNLNLLSGSVLNIQVPSQVQNAVAVDIQKGATVNLYNGAMFNLDDKDKWNGTIYNNGGILETIGLVNEGGGGLQQINGSTTFTDKSHIAIVDMNSYITGGDVAILNNSSLYLGAGILDFNASNLNMANNSFLNVMNGVIDKAVIGNMTVNDTNHFAVDLAPRNHVGDTFIIDNLKSDESGVLNVSDFNFIGLAPIDRNINFQIFDAGSISDVTFTATDKSIFTPIGNYQLYSNGGGSYTASLTSYNPQVYRGQVATLAMYNNQLLIDDMLLNHVSLQSERLLAQGENANKYAATLPQFAPYQYKKEDGGLWFKSYANFETLSMTQGLNVGNNTYGSLVGADLPVVDMENGWKFLPTAYIAYSGGHQYFDGVSMYQNGGQGGFMGTFMKGDFIGSVLAYAGGYANEMSVAGTTDNTGNWFAGTAAKAAYNIRATEHFTIQPTAFISYNIFGKQNWNTDFGAMSMNSGLLNGINVAPGLNLIYARETWSIYGTVQYMFNINEQVGGRAGNVALDNLEMRHGYIQYGIGATKTWQDRLSSYVQVTLRNGGRTGVGFQLGLQYLFDWTKPGKKTQQTTAPTVKKVLKTQNKKVMR